MMRPTLNQSLSPKRPLLPVVGFIFALLGCGDSTPSEDEPPAPQTSERCVPEQSAVVYDGDLMPDNQCPFGDGPCDEDYLAFPDVAADWAAPLTEFELEDVLAQMQAGSLALSSGPFDAAGLKTAVIEGMRTGFLLDGLHARELRVQESDPLPLAQFEPASWAGVPAIGWEFQLEDPYVGRLRGIAARPEGEGPFGVVVAIHGHHESAEVWLAGRQAAVLLDAGYAIVAPTLRVNDAGTVETEVTRTLLGAGFSFAGLRVYEQLLAMRYAASIPELDRCKVGLLGHSGGAVAANVTLWLDPGIRGLITDLQSNYFVGDHQYILDETAPGLYRLSTFINDFEQSPVPALLVPYNFETADSPPVSSWPEMIEFLDAATEG